MVDLRVGVRVFIFYTLPQLIASSCGSLIFRFIACI